VPMTCLDGYFIDPLSALEGRPSLGESIVRAAPHGAIASFSPTGMGTTYGHDYLNRGLFIALFENNITELGPATAWAKYYLYSQTSAYLDLIETYTLFGDPATSLKVLRPDVKISKSVQFVTPIDAGDTITFTLTYSNSGARPARQVVIRDDLPQILTNPSVTSSGAEIILRPNSQFTWDVSDLGSGEGGIITITAQLSQWIGGVLTNTSLISAIEEDPNLPTDSSSASFGQFFFPLIYR